MAGQEEKEVRKTIYPENGGAGNVRAGRQGSGNGDTVDLAALFGYYFEKIWLLIIAVVVGAVIAGVITITLIPVKYTATARMYMVSASKDTVVDLSDLNLGASLSNDYVELMKSRPILEEVAQNLGLDYTYSELSSMVSLSVVTDTRIVRISTTSTSPEEAKNISNELADISKRQLPEIMDAPEPNIAEYAITPDTKSSPSLTRNVVIGALVCLLIVIAVLTVKFLSDDTLKNEDDVEREFGFLPLAVIPEGTIPGLEEYSEEGGRRAQRKRRIAAGKAESRKKDGRR